MFEKSIWFKQLHNYFKVRDGLSSEQAYRRLIDNLDEFLEEFEEGNSAESVYNEYWE